MRSGADSPLTQDRSRDVNNPPGNLTHRSTQATVELAFSPGCLRMSSQVVSIPSSVFYAPPQLESDSGLQAGGIGQFCAPLPA